MNQLIMLQLSPIIPQYPIIRLFGHQKRAAETSERRVGVARPTCYDREILQCLIDKIFQICLHFYGHKTASTPYTKNNQFCLVVPLLFHFQFHFGVSTEAAASYLWMSESEWAFYGMISSYSYYRSTFLSIISSQKTISTPKVKTC